MKERKRKKPKSACASRRLNFCINNILFSPCVLAMFVLVSWQKFANGISYGKSMPIRLTMPICLHKFDVLQTFYFNVFYLVYCWKKTAEKNRRVRYRCCGNLYINIITFTKNILISCDRERERERKRMFR